jgi:hypothetical protein
VANLPGHSAAWTRRLHSKRFTRSAWVVILLVAGAATAWASTITQPTSSDLAFLDAAVAGLRGGCSSKWRSACAASVDGRGGTGLAIQCCRLRGPCTRRFSWWRRGILTGRLRRPWQFVVAISRSWSDCNYSISAIAAALLSAPWGVRRLASADQPPYAALSAVGVSGVISTAWSWLGSARRIPALKHCSRTRSSWC